LLILFHQNVKRWLRPRPSEGWGQSFAKTLRIHHFLFKHAKKSYVSPLLLLLQSISPTFLRAHFLHKILAPIITKLNVTREKLPKRLLYEKGPRKMLPTFLQTAFLPIFFSTKNTNTSHKHRKAAQSNFLQKKLLLKCWWNWQLSTQLLSMLIL